MCHHCDKRGHLAKVCRSKQSNTSWTTSQWNSGQGNHSTKWVGLEEAEMESDGFVETPVLQVKGTSERLLIATLEIDEVMVLMEVDTGAAVTLMSKETQKSLFPKVKLQKPKVRLQTYTAKQLSVLGVLTVQVVYRGYTGSHTLYVVQGNGPTLLGHDWIQRLA